MEKKLIYAAYGSNLLEERFKVYISGEIYNNRKYPGCRINEEPIDLGYAFVPHRLYFARRSPRWNYRGVAFLCPDEEKDENRWALVRLWEITESQLEDIQKQEGELWYYETLELKLKKLHLKEGKELSGLPVCTLTGRWGNEKNQPSKKYLDTIRKGIKETTNWDDHRINEYLNKFLKSKFKCL